MTGPRRRAALQLLSPAVLGMVVVLSCSSPTEGCGCSPVPSPVGSWIATQFEVTPTGQAPINVLAAGGSLTITMGTDLVTSGTLSIPASANAGNALNATMAGTYSFELMASEVRFTQTADTFVRDLTWQFPGNALSVTNQTAGSAAFTITLHRQ